MINPDLLETLRCPMDPRRQTRLTLEGDRLICPGCGLKYPIRDGPVNSWLLKSAAILFGLLLLAALWWWLPARPNLSTRKPGGEWLKMMVSADGQVMLGVQRGELYLLDTATLGVQASCPFTY